MFNTALRQLKHAVLMLLVLIVITGAAYPLLITGAAQLIFPFEANGSILKDNGIVTGSAMIGQSFSDPARFWGRPSATSPMPYNAAASSGSNFGPTNPAFLTVLKKRAARMRQAHGNRPAPVELVTASGSGLDPHISPAAALYQLPRLVEACGLEETFLRQLVERHIEGRQFGFLGEPRVNVLALNQDLSRRTVPSLATGEHDEKHPKNHQDN